MANPFTLDTLLNGLDIPGLGGVEKVASVTEASQPVSGVAKDLEEHLNKQANEENPDMSTSQKGRNIAAGVLALVKRAMDEAGTSGPNNVISETAVQVGSSTAGQQEIPKDGTITQTLQSMLQKGLATGAVGPDQLYLNAIQQGRDEGNSPIGLMSSDGRDINAIPAGGSMSEQVEKTAALVHLVDNGVDFDTAVTLIKQAEEQIYADEWEQEKVAAVNDLMSQGYQIEDAVYLVKQAVAADSRVLSAAGRGLTYAKGKGQAALEGARGFGKYMKDGVMHPGRALAEAGANKDEILAAMQASKAINANRKGFGATMGRIEDAVTGYGGIAAGYGKAVAPAAALAGGVGLAGYGGYKALDKKAAAIEGLILAGYSVEQALQALEG